MKDFLSCIKLNNEALVVLSSGDNHRALKMFKAALSLLHRSVLTPMPQQQARHHKHRKQSDMILVEQEPIQLPGSVLVVSPRWTRSCQQECSYVYNRAFRINVLHEQDRERNILGAEISPTVAALVIFNMAISYHRMAASLSVASSKGSNGALITAAGTRALNLYTGALRLLPAGEASATGIDVNLLRCAALNNRSQLHYEKGEYALARQGLDEVHRMMYLFVGRSHSAGQQPRVFQQDDLTGLLLNVFFLRKPTLAAAA
jgi:hypothetical protein